jgi:hypothetical protein
VKVFTPSQGKSEEEGTVTLLAESRQVPSYSASPVRRLPTPPRNDHVHHPRPPRSLPSHLPPARSNASDVLRSDATGSYSSDGSRRAHKSPRVMRGALELSAEAQNNGLVGAGDDDAVFMDIMGVPVQSAYFKGTPSGASGSGCCCVM